MAPAEAGGDLQSAAPLAEATKAVKPIDRTALNSWEDPRIVDWVEKTGRKKLVIAGQ